MRHLALLRGINVGGNALIRMAELKACFEELGFDAVSTYIASGNVLFDTPATEPAALESRIEAAIEARFALPVRTLVLDRADYARIVAAIPPAWIGDASVRANVAFVLRGTDAAAAVSGLEPDPAIDEIVAIDGAILWATRRDALNRSAIRRLMGAPVYKELTIRSLNTTLKLGELLMS